MSYLHVAGLGAASKRKTQKDVIAEINAKLTSGSGNPFKGAASILPLSSADKKLLADQPLNFFLKLFSPIQGLVERVIERVNKRSGKTSRKYNALSSKKIDMRTVQPNDAKAQKGSPQSFPFYKTVRTFCQYIAIVFTAPQLFTDELARELLHQPIGTGGVLFLPDLGMYNGRVGLGVAGGDDATAATISSVVTAVGPFVTDILVPMLPGILQWMLEEASKPDPVPVQDPTTGLQPTQQTLQPEQTYVPMTPPPVPAQGVSPQVLIIGGVGGLLLLALILKR